MIIAQSFYRKIFHLSTISFNFCFSCRNSYDLSKQYLFYEMLRIKGIFSYCYLSFIMKNLEELGMFSPNLIFMSVCTS